MADPTNELDATLPKSWVAVVSYTGNEAAADESKVQVGTSASTDAKDTVTEPPSLEESIMSGQNTPTSPALAAAVNAAAPTLTAEMQQAIASRVDSIVADRQNQTVMTQHITTLVTAAEQNKTLATAAQAEVTALKAANADLQRQNEALKVEASTKDTKLTEATTALTAAQATIKEANEKFAKAEAATKAEHRKGILTKASITSGKLFDRAVKVGEDNKLVMADEDFDAVVENLPQPTPQAAASADATGSGAPATPATPATGTPAPATPAPATPSTPAPATPAAPGTGGPAAQAVAHVSAPATGTPLVPDLSGAGQFTQAVAGLTNGGAANTESNPFAAIGCAG